MQHITYEFAKADDARRTHPFGPVVVRLDGRVVGKIWAVSSGYQYRPKNAGVGGDVFPTLAACQASLEPEVDPGVGVDIFVENHGTIFLVDSHTVVGEQWLDEHLPADAGRFGGKYVVEHRFIADMVDGMRADGLVVA